MKVLLFIGWLIVGSCWFPGVSHVWAAKSQSAPSAGQSVTAKDFEEVILSALSRQYGRADHQVSMRILFPRKPLLLSKGKIHLEVEKIAGGARMGRRSFRVGLFLNRQFIKTVNVVGEVKAQAMVTTPVRWIKPNEVVAAEDVLTMKIDVPSLTHDFILDPNEVIGKQVLRPLSPRQPIRKIMLDDPPLVHKGDRVMLEVHRGGLFVQAVGLAKASGKSGDTIPVKNQHSGREVVGTIIGSGLVEVGF